jgi:predicted flap endonuclease-1-like 5' DNA nuclease
MVARLNEMRDAISASRKDMGDELAREMSDWINEGESVIERAMERMRASGVTGDLRSAADNSTRQARAGLKKMTRAVDDTLDVIDPDTPLSTINGIGPSYEKKLAEAGVAGVSGFISATGTVEDVANLAKTTGFSTGTIESWREQADLTRVDGIGGTYLGLLHRVDVWTLEQLSKCDPGALTDELNSVEMQNAADQMPSIYQVRQWVARAGKLLSSS